MADGAEIQERVAKSRKPGIIRRPNLFFQSFSSNTSPAYSADNVTCTSICEYDVGLKENYVTKN